MKQFIKTLAGKTILFIVCIISICVFAANIIAILYFSDNVVNLYRYSEQDILQEVAAERILNNDGCQILFHVFNVGEEYRCDYDFQITDETGKVIEETDGFRGREAESFSVFYGAALQDSKYSTTRSCSDSFSAGGGKGI